MIQPSDSADATHTSTMRAALRNAPSRLPGGPPCMANMSGHCRSGVQLLGSLTQTGTRRPPTVSMTNSFSWSPTVGGAPGNTGGPARMISSRSSMVARLTSTAHLAERSDASASRKASWYRPPYKQGVTGSSPVAPTRYTCFPSGEYGPDMGHFDSHVPYRLRPFSVSGNDSTTTCSGDCGLGCVERPDRVTRSSQPPPIWPLVRLRTAQHARSSAY